jgi:hypothetical protein
MRDHLFRVCCALAVDNVQDVRHLPKWESEIASYQSYASTRYSDSSSVDAPGFLKVFSPQMHSVELFLANTRTRSRVLVGLALVLVLAVAASAQQANQEQTTAQEPQAQSLSARGW